MSRGNGETMATDGEYEVAKDGYIDLDGKNVIPTKDGLMIDCTTQAIEDAVLTITPAPEAIGPSISFEPGISMRFPNGGAIMVKEGHFEIVGRCLFVDGDGMIISEFGGE